VALALVLAAPLGAQSPALTPSGDSTRAKSYTHEGAWVGGVLGGLTLGAAFYSFTHRPGGAINTAAGDIGASLVGAAIGAAGGALFGAFIGAVIPKH
jgi:hypothetical protein